MSECQIACEGGLTCAWLWDGSRGKALSELSEAERLAPSSYVTIPSHGRRSVRSFTPNGRPRGNAYGRCPTVFTWMTRSYSPDSYSGVVASLPSVARHDDAPLRTPSGGVISPTPGPKRTPIVRYSGPMSRPCAREGARTRRVLSGGNGE